MHRLAERMDTAYLRLHQVTAFHRPKPGFIMNDSITLTLTAAALTQPCFPAGHWTETSQGKQPAAAQRSAPQANRPPRWDCF